MRTFVASTASQLSLIHASSHLCSVSFYTESHQFLEKDNNNWSWDSSPFHHPLSLGYSFSSFKSCWSLSAIELTIPEVSVLTPLFALFISTPRVLALLFPFSAYSLVLLCMETLLISSAIHFSGTILWGAWRTPFFSPKSFTFFTSELSEHTGTCSSYLELHGHWFHPAELLPFIGGEP